jgi:hypothetical protein
MGNPFPPEEPFWDEEIHRAEEEAEEQAEEARREHASQHEEPASDGGGRPASGLPWWRRLFRRS